MSAIPPLNSNILPPKVAASQLSGAQFKETLNANKPVGLDAHAELVALRDKILQGGKLEPKQLLYYQIRAHQFGLGVELVSKVGESVSATVRRFEQGQ